MKTSQHPRGAIWLFFFCLNVFSLIEFQLTIIERLVKFTLKFTSALLEVQCELASQ